MPIVLRKKAHEKPMGSTPTNGQYIPEVLVSALLVMSFPKISIASDLLISGTPKNLKGYSSDRKNP
jgi:hypothetical protein